MRKDLTELVFILDRSGSMHGLEADTIGGFNSTIEKQREIDGDVLVSTVLFDHDSKVLHDRVPIDSISPMTEKDYFVGGSTALMDALGSAIRHIGIVHKYAREEDVPEHTVFIITTDGMENASRSFDSDTVKGMIEEKKEKNGWEFIFLAANIDAVESAARIGIDRTRAADYSATPTGIHEMYRMASEAITCKREHMDLGRCDWKRPKKTEK